MNNELEKKILDNFEVLLPKIKDKIKNYKNEMKLGYYEIPIRCGLATDVVEFDLLLNKFVSIRYKDDETETFHSIDIKHIEY